MSTSIVLRSAYAHLRLSPAYVDRWTWASWHHTLIGSFPVSAEAACADADAIACAGE